LRKEIDDPFLLDEEVEDLFVEFPVRVNIAPVGDLPVGDVEDMDHRDENFFEFDFEGFEPRFVNRIRDEPDERFPHFLVIVDRVLHELGDRLEFIVRRELVDDEFALVERE
jgi:hypothetical protein